MRIEALKGARKSYWQTPSALWARSFDAYVQDALSAKGESSPWLVHGTRTRDQHDPLVSAYPDGEQRQRLQQLRNAQERTLAQFDFNALTRVFDVCRG